MPSYRRAATGVAALSAATALVGLTPTSAAAHGAVFNPVSRVAACYAEGPETPKSQVCKDLVADSGTQPLYDWNEVNIANAAGQHQALIPDGKLCSANREKYRALDWARMDWPATSVAKGPFDFKVRVTAAHAGTMTVYITRPGFDPTKPLKWSDLDATPVAVYNTTRTATDGYYNFTGDLPARNGRHIVYKVWQRNDSPEAFYSCSDVDFGGGTTVPPVKAQAPTEAKIAAGATLSTVSHAGHGGDEQAPALSAEAAGTPSSPLLPALAGAGALAAFAGGSLLLSRRRNASAA
ncbi:MULTISPECIES: lytic polysaccharide monooxygenase [unclassified Streptomyces]|uniref:lytic polysaccharide monooxygenase auxiliary activity family 9 protein n=1 Tax=unclassified Streptomyces TaxID=2593676 RepID=UPI0016617EA0|nr:MULTISPECIES: lytic polysaccharide monooxygenase [unclassified Streptomyces]MBD0708419.1 chitin-binding protein [Streptomyces sp. CBMA291]MBD0717867.1 chitin-binding protein [Streptomyces sp. CBMA370]